MFSSLQKISIIAKGRYSEVYKYQDTLTFEFRVIKKHPKDLLYYTKESNVRELEAYTKLYKDKSWTHPNLLYFYGYAEDRDNGFFKFEFVNGYDLRRVINESKSNKKEKFVSKENILNYILQVIEGLEVLHSKGIYHCDVKPENILIYKDTAKIVDLGSSIISEKRIIAVRDEKYIGTPGYLPPEVSDCTYKGDLDLEFVDLFGLGGTIYYCFTNIPPFAADHNGQINSNLKKMNIDLDLIKDEKIRNVVKHVICNQDRWNMKQVKEALSEILEDLKSH